MKYIQIKKYENKEKFHIKHQERRDNIGKKIGNTSFT